MILPASKSSPNEVLTDFTRRKNLRRASGIIMALESSLRASRAAQGRPDACLRRRCCPRRACRKPGAKGSKLKITARLARREYVANQATNRSHGVRLSSNAAHQRLPEGRRPLPLKTAETLLSGGTRGLYSSSGSIPSRLAFPSIKASRASKAFDWPSNCLFSS